MAFARQPEVSKFSERVNAELDSGRLSLNDDANMLLDFGLQDRIGALLSACYEKLWLIPALAAVSRRPPSTDPEELLAQFCAGGTDGQGIFGSASTLRGAAAAAARRGCVERIVRLIALLDVGASRVLLPTHPALLCADSPCRSTERLLQQLWRLVGAKEGDVVIHLRRLGLDLRHSQPKHAAKPTPVPLSAAKFLAPATLLSGEVLARLLDQYDHSIAVTRFAARSPPRRAASTSAARTRPPCCRRCPRAASRRKASSMLGPSPSTTVRRARRRGS